MKKWLFCFVLLVSLNGFAQERIYFDCGFHNKVTKGCNYADVIEEETYWRLKYYNCLGHLIKSETRKSLRNFKNENLEGLSIIYNYDGSIYSTGNYSSGMKQGIWMIYERDTHQMIETFEHDIKIKSIEIGPNKDTVSITNFIQKGVKNINSHLKFFSNGQVAYDRWFDTKGNDSMTYYYSNGVTKVVCQYDSVKVNMKDSVQMPKFIGDDIALNNLLAENIVYPTSLYESEVCGTVYVSFNITDSGNIESIKTINAQQHPQFEKEAIRVIRLTQGKWIAGKKNGQAVNTKCLIPIEFSIE